MILVKVDFTLYITYIDTSHKKKEFSRKRFIYVARGFERENEYCSIK
jgi:hypothetical protein